MLDVGQLKILFRSFNTYLIYLGTIADTFCSACKFKGSSSFLNVHLQIKW